MRAKNLILLLVLLPQSLFAWSEVKNGAKYRGPVCIPMNGKICDESTVQFAPVGSELAEDDVQLNNLFHKISVMPLQNSVKEILLAAADSFDNEQLANLLGESIAAQRSSLDATTLVQLKEYALAYFNGEDDLAKFSEFYRLVILSR